MEVTVPITKKQFKFEKLVVINEEIHISVSLHWEVIQYNMIYISYYTTSNHIVYILIYIYITSILY